jgi:hypothetical protein
METQATYQPNSSRIPFAHLLETIFACKLQDQPGVLQRKAKADVEYLGW